MIHTRAELESMDMMHLRNIARALGCKDRDISDAMYSRRPRAAMVELVMRKEKAPAE